MIIVSQNALKYEIGFPDDCVFRINLAWCDSLDQLNKILEKHKDKKIFLDLPVGRIKPPNNKYGMDELEKILKSNPQIEFFAISNVESRDEIEKLKKFIPKYTNIVPKIESPTGINNIAEIVSVLNASKKYVMLDHDDLFSKIIKSGENSEKFPIYIKKLVDFCESNNIFLLRTVGVIFSDNENRTTQYIK